MQPSSVETTTSWIDKVNSWRTKYVSDRQFTLALSFIVGLLSALAAFLLHSLIKQIEVLLTAGFDMRSFNWMYLVLPVVGIYLTSLFVKYVVKDNISHGITRILYAISRKQSRLKAHNCWSSVIASAITIGFGGSVGAEAPIVLTGSAIGSNLGQTFKLDHKTMMVLVGCGAASAIAGIFKAPIAGLVFTLEVLMIDLTMASLLPILIASVTATCFTYILVGSDSLFHFTLDAEWQVERIPATILLGIFCGLVSLYFIRLMTACEKVFSRLGNHSYLKLALGGGVLSSLIFLFPSLYGEGYSSINILLNGRTEADWGTILNNSLWSRRMAHAVCRHGVGHKGAGHLGHQWRWRMWWYVCSVALHRGFRRFLLLTSVECQRHQCLCAGTEFRPAGNGRCDGRCDACAPDRHLPHCRDNRRL